MKITLSELVSFFFWSTAKFAFCFASSWKTDFRIIVSAVCEISSEIELTPALSFNGFGRANRKLLIFYKLIYKEH